MKKLLNIVSSILKFFCNIYNTWYGIFDLILGVCLLSKITNSTLCVILIIAIIVDLIRWWKGVFKNFATKSQLFGTIRQNNVFNIVGGIGSGKSTLGQYVLRKLVPKNKQYFNTINSGYKAFTYRHLLLQDKLENQCGVFCDEMGAMMDSFHYGKEDSPTRSRVEKYFKFFRQFYGSNSFHINIDQSEANMNTSLYKNVYYYIQCKSVEVKPSGIIPYWICELGLFWLNRKRFKKINNPFSNVHLTYLEFNKLGDYAEHYSVNVDINNMTCIVVPTYKMFGTLDTYVFRQFNPAEEVEPYIWGTDAETDKRIMEDNFDLTSLKENIKNTFVKRN